MKCFKAKVIVTSLHLILLAISLSVIEGFRSPSTSLFWIFWYTLHRITTFSSFLFYFWASLRDPGYLVLSSAKVEDKPSHHKQSSSLASKATLASAVKHIDPSSNITSLQHNIPRHSCDHIYNERGNISECSEESFSQQFYQMSEGSIPNLNIHESTTSKIIISKPIPYKPEPISPVIYSQEELELSNRDNDLKRSESYTQYCIECHINTPMRARHCKDCGKCVAMFDHHCPFLGTCIGEKNRLFFFWYVFFQALECWTGLAICSEGVGDETDDWDKWVRENIKFVIIGTVAFLLGLLVTILWVYHLNLACRNITTWENLRWDKIGYLEGHKSSPFSKGIVQNFLYYCRFNPSITDWEKDQPGF
ncbi:hypothetical protein SteCoe_31639 [Stentor coeruleus]|uniref:Palmitoyltransferase n=1 Tax=Stentor coeruleus TaxID=5963 RepID=A0A1R2B0T3_9CILI|nr:hypothetical protein SteCoe_31639 [Stentor coeruleus]